MKRFYKFDSERGIATVYILSGDLSFIGMAKCHKDDEDFMSEKTGLQIAEVRAEINFLKHIRDNELKPAIKVLEHLHNNMKTSKHYNKESYEATMLRRQVAIKKNELTAVIEEIDRSKKFLTSYINSKEELYTKLRKGKNS